MNHDTGSRSRPGAGRRSVAALGLSLLALPASAQEQQPDLAYTIRPRPFIDRTALDVELRLVGDSDGETRIALPSCNYGTPRLWCSVRDVRVEGATVDTDEAGWMHTLVHEPDASITFRYSLALDPSADQGVAYRPAAGPGRFHFLDSQWRATVRDRERPQRYRVSFADVPDGWTTYSNLGDGRGPYERTARERDISAFIGGGLRADEGGNLHSATFDSGGKAVSVHLLGLPEPEHVVESARAILTAQGKRFGPFVGGRDHYVVSIFPRARIQAGTAIPDAFVCYVSTASEPAKLEALIAHEFFHNWLPRTGAVDVWRDGAAVDEFRLDWFHEGYTEFIARRMLLDGGRVDAERYVAFFNHDLEEQAENPQRTATLTEVETALRDRTYTNRHERTSYFRGPMLALRHDLAIRRAHPGRSLYDVVNDFLAIAREQNGLVTEAQFFALFERYDVDARADYRRHIVEGHPVDIAADAFGPEFTCKPHVVHPFERGFDLGATRRAEKITGVVPGSAAERAGLRDDQPFVGYERAAEGDRHITVRIRDGDGERSITWSPRARGVETVRFVRRGD